MQEIKCPNCGEVFQVDESSYDSIVKQVRDKEFSIHIDGDKFTVIYNGKEITQNVGKEITI